MKDRIKVVTVRDAVSVFKLLGYEVSRTSGSHIILNKANSNPVVLTKCGKTVALGTLRQNMQRANINYEGFNKLLEAL